MNKNRIEKNARKVWLLISRENKQWEFTELQQATGLSARDLHLAIGWLVHENKIQFGHRMSGSVDVEYYGLDINPYIG